jgi:hypothetical protein
VDNFLRSFSGWVPYVALVIFVLLFRTPLRALVAALAQRVKDGSSVDLGPFRLGELVRSTEDAKRGAEARGEEIQVFGDPDCFKLLFKAQGPHWKKSTKAMAVPGGCLVQVSSERQGATGDWTTAEALQYVPGVVLDAENQYVTLRAAP